MFHNQHNCCKFSLCHLTHDHCRMQAWLPKRRPKQKRFSSYCIRSLNTYSFLFKIISAAITPGIHPNRVRMKTIRNEPQPLSITARGGNMMAKITRNTDIRCFVFRLLLANREHSICLFCYIVRMAIRRLRLNLLDIQLRLLRRKGRESSYKIRFSTRADDNVP